MNRLTPYRVGSIYDKNGRWFVEGPGNGFGYDAGTLFSMMRLSSEDDAKAATYIANEAYTQGYRAAQREIQAALGLKT